jgi:hypothetical protein
MGDRAVDCARLESVCAERHRGFESPPIRFAREMSARNAKGITALHSNSAEIRRCLPMSHNGRQWGAIGAWHSTTLSQGLPRSKFPTYLHARVNVKQSQLRHVNSGLTRKDPPAHRLLVFRLDRLLGKREPLQTTINSRCDALLVGHGGSQDPGTIMEPDGLG